MSEVKKCPKCGGEIEEGNFRGFGAAFIRFTKSKSLFPLKLETVAVFACQKCGFIELYKEMKKKKG